MVDACGLEVGGLGSVKVRESTVCNSVDHVGEREEEGERSRGELELLLHI